MKKAHLYEQVASGLEQQINSGVLKVGDKLPSIRTLCHEQGISLNTAKQAYLELEKKALIESRPQSGFYVTRSPLQRLSIPATSRPAAGQVGEEAGDLIARVYKSLGDPDITGFSLGVPDSRLLPVARLNKALVAAMRSLPASGTGYEEVQGNRKLRRAVARWSFTWGGHLEEDDIVTTTGCMSALSYSLMTITRPGDTIAVESPVYFGVLQLANTLGLKVLELPTHPVTGIDPDALKKALPKINCCLLVSNFNNPLGSCMPDEHKRAVVAMLTQYNIPLIEDDLYGDVYFGDHRPRSCKTYDEAGIVLWCASSSKTLAPGYRVGWVAPGRFRDQLVRMKMIQSVSSTTITQEVIGSFLESGRYEKHLRNMRRTLQANSLQYSRAIATYFPEGTRVSHPQGGFVLWVELPPSVDAAVLYESAMRQRISIAPGRMFTLQPQFHHCMRLSYGLCWDEQLEHKLKVLGKLATGLAR